MNSAADLNDSGPTRDELVARLQLMESMVAEGRRATGRYGWIFVLWGLVDIVGTLWQTAKPDWFGPWPIVLGVGVVLQIAGLRFICVGGPRTAKNRALSAVWQMLGVTLLLYCFTAMFTHRSFGHAYMAAIFMILGMAHGISAIILRWTVQGVVSVLWLAGGFARYVIPGQWMDMLFLGESAVGMVFFGLYLMLLEGRRSGGAVHG
jgi:hypothetical protein